MGKIKNSVVVVLGRGDFRNGEDMRYGEDSGRGRVGRVRIPGAVGVLAAVGEVAVFKEVRGGGEEPSGFGFGFLLTRLKFLGTHLWRELCSNARMDLVTLASNYNHINILDRNEKFLR